MTDMINPNHYRGGRQFEPIAVIEDWDLNYRLGNALKYISRNGRKPGEDPREGLKKAIWYLERELASYDQPAPYGVTYEDILEDYAACAADGYEYILETQQAPACDVDLDELRKDLDQFDDDEIVRTFERRGFMFGVDKHGRTYNLGQYGGPIT